MKNLNMLSLFKGLLFCLAVILSSCAKDNKKTPISNGGGEYGGGDVILEKATQEDIVNTIPKVKAILPYNLHYLEYMLKGFENVTENQIKSASADTKVASQQNRNFILTPTLTDKIDQYKITILHYKNLGQILFSRNNEKKQNAYELLKNIKILTPTNKACKDSKGNEKDGSVHTLQKGDICISPLRLSNKLKKVHLFNSLLGLVLHEIVHRLGGDKVEAEAKLAEYIVRNTPESYASLFFAEDLKSSTQELILQVSDLLDS
ncbi:MAG: hypothetical protein KDD40_03715 [Bdellovibrionales bacterium]|nr:hypothetical protein [Bdellovibrionales bacterium]